MKKLLIIGLMSLSIFACDNQKKEQTTQVNEEQIAKSNFDEELVKNFKESYQKSCLSSGEVTKAFCDCVYSRLTEKYSEKEMVTIYINGDKVASDKLNAYINESAKKCLN